MKTFAVLGYSGGKCKELAQYPIHFAIDDMQIAEDLQLVVGHMCMQWLCANPIKLPKQKYPSCVGAAALSRSPDNSLELPEISELFL